MEQIKLLANDADCEFSADKMNRILKGHQHRNYTNTATNLSLMFDMFYKLITTYCMSKQAYSFFTK